MKIKIERYRKLPTGLSVISVLLFVMAVLAALMSAFYFSPFGWVLFERSYHYFLLAVLLPQIFLWLPLKPGNDLYLFRIIDYLLAVLAFAVCGFLGFYAKVIVFRWGIFPPIEGTVLSLILWGLLVETARRTVSSVFAVIFVLLSIYPLYSFFMPKPFWAPTDIGILDLAHFHILGSDGLMGIVMQVFGSILFGYLLYAVALQICGAGEFFSLISKKLFGRSRGGSAKTAVLASGLLGSISGSPIANVLTTGAFTIPAMKKSGLPPHLAGAIEASASTGGTILPPIMGAVAFIMAQFLESNYATVAIAAMVPGIMYYIVVYTQIDLYALRINLKSEVDDKSIDELPSIGSLLLQNMHIILSLAILIYILFGLRLETRAPWFATAGLFLLSMVRLKTRLGLQQLVSSLQEGARVIGEALGLLAPLGLIIGAFLVNGVAHSLPHDIISIAGENVLLLLALGAISALILGMGVSLIATYIFLAILLAPALESIGIDRFAAHFFILYCGLWAHLTPPVAIVAFTAARVAEASPFQTAFAAMRLGMAKYVLPFAIALKPALIFRNTTAMEAGWVITLTIGGLVAISIALEGYCWRLGHLHLVVRAIIIGGSFVMIFGDLLWQVAAVIVLVAAFGTNFLVTLNARKMKRA